MLRAFVAVELDGALRQALARAQADLRDRLRPSDAPGLRVQWVRPDSIHLTLKFLGDIPEERVAEIRTALAPAVAGRTRFTAAVEGLGVFPDLRGPRILWVGLADRDGALASLAADVEAALTAAGFAAEAKPFHPHLTLARIKEGSREAGRAWGRERLLDREMRLGDLTVEALSLMRSELRPSGAVYTELWRLPLKEA